MLLFVNGMGGTPLSELYIVFRRAAEILDERGITLSRSLVGSLVTSLEMQGASISVLKLDDELTALWDAPVHTAALRWGIYGRDGGSEHDGRWTRPGSTGWMTASAAVIGEHKHELNTLDREIGDGDHGENMDRGFRAVVDALGSCRTMRRRTRRSAPSR